MQRFITFVVIAVFALVSAADVCPTESQHPVVLVPGLMGSILEGKLNGIPLTSLPNILCKTQTSEFETMWVSVSDLLVWTDCLMYYLSLEWSSGAPLNRPQVELRVPKQFGSTYPINYLAPESLFAKYSSYYHTAISALEGLGFQENATLLGAAYDWRHFPTQSFNEDLRQLIERAYEQRGGTRVVLVGHSMGCPFTYHFLMSQSLAWRRKYIERYMPVAPVWTGTGMAVYAMLAKTFLGLEGVFGTLGQEARTFPSIFFLMPSNNYLGGSSTAEPVLAWTPKYTYTPSNISTLLTRAGISWAPTALEMRKQFYENGHLLSLDFPGVPTTVVWSRNVATVQTTHYLIDATVGSVVPIADFGDGDGLVEISSLEYAFNKWSAEGKNVEKLVMEDSVNHLAIVSDNRFIQLLLATACHNGTWSDDFVYETSSKSSTNSTEDAISATAASLASSVLLIATLLMQF